MIAFDMAWGDGDRVEVSYEMDHGEIGNYQVIRYRDKKDITSELTKDEEETVVDAIYEDHWEN